MQEDNRTPYVDDNKQQRFLKEIIASGPVATAVIEAVSYKIISYNRAFERLITYDIKGGSGIGVTFLDLLADEEHYRFAAQLAIIKANQDHSKQYTVYNLQKKYTKSKLCYIYASQLDKEEADGKDYYNLLIIPDVSKWTIPFLSFDTRDLFFEQFADDSFGTFEWEINSGSIVASEGIFKIFNLEYTQKHIAISTITQYIHEEYKREIKNLLSEHPEEEQRINLELKITTGNSKEKTLYVRSKIVHDNMDEPYKYIGSVRDITEQRDIEENLKKNVAELNRSNKELEEFAYVASHDLQEPLRKITTFSDRLSEKYASALTGEGTMYLERMMASANNMRMLINNLLEFSRITKSLPSFAPTNLSFIVHQVKNDLELIIDDTQTEIRYSNLPTIAASVSQMKQLFSNLISNSIKFKIPGQKAIITIGTEPMLADEIKQYNLRPEIDYIKISFTDNGIGFENEYAQKIFQIFQRLHGKSEYPGSGIGLAICKKIVEHHHGIIYAESTPGEGSKFTLILPQTQP